MGGWHLVPTVAAVDDLRCGTGLDWFFANIQGSSKDKIHSEAGEVITASV